MTTTTITLEGEEGYTLALRITGAVNASSDDFAMELLDLARQAYGSAFTDDFREKVLDSYEWAYRARQEEAEAESEYEMGHRLGREEALREVREAREDREPIGVGVLAVDDIPRPATGTFKKGDRVEIIADLGHHAHPIGTVVTLGSLWDMSTSGREMWMTKENNPKGWKPVVRDDEIRKAAPEVSGAVILGEN